MNNKSWKIKEMPSSLSLTASPMQQKQGIRAIRWMVMLTTAFYSLTKAIVLSVL
jgi:hypothetical protein